MKKDIIRALILSVVIVFSMLAAFTQGMKVNCESEIRIQDIKTVSKTNTGYREPAGVCFIAALGHKEKTDPTDPQAVVAAAAQWNAMYQ